MDKVLETYRNSRFKEFIQRHQKYAPLLFFIGGFIFDSLTLRRIDRLYDLVILCLHMSSLTIVLYLYNLADDGRWRNTFLRRFQLYFPLVIQFSFGALSSAFVIYYFRSVSLSKTIFFFVILVALLIANEFLRKRISNKHLQFSLYFFVSFTFCTFIIPVFVKMINTSVFVFSGLVSLISTLLLLMTIYYRSPSTRKEVKLKKILSFIFGIYFIINVFYFFKLIPPVPLSLENGMAAHKVEKNDQEYIVTYETDEWYVFWRDHRSKFISSPGEKVYIFTSIFAPTHIEKSIFHRWKWFNAKTDDWEFVEDIGYSITGGRGEGFRGYTFKKNVKKGLWKVEVITEEELILGVIDFKIIYDDLLQPKNLIEKTF